MQQRMLTALANRIEIEYLSIHDLTMTEIELYIDFMECHYFKKQSI